MSRIEANHEAALLIGDKNRAVGGGKEGVVGNKREVSYGGSLVRDLIGSGDYIMLNNLSLARSGPWTRVCPATGRKSCLDLAMGSVNLLPYMKMMMIDSKRLFPPVQGGQ